MCDKLYRNKNMQISEFCLKENISVNVVFWHWAMMARFHPRRRFQLPRKSVSEGEMRVEKEQSEKNTIFHFNEFLLKCQMPLTGNNSKNMFNFHPAM